MRSGKVEIIRAPTSTGETVGTSVPAGILQAHAYAFAATFRLKEIASALTGATVAIDKDCLVASWPPRAATDGDKEGAALGLHLAILFDFGGLVLIGLSPSERERVLGQLVARLAPEPHAPHTEDLYIEVRPGSRVEAQFDRVVLSEATLPALKVISLLLAQSVAMDYYDEDVQEIIKRTDAITKSLQAEGRLPGRVNDLVRFIGSCIATKNDVIATMSLFDKPDSTWEDQQIDQLYNGLRQELEIDDRFRALEAKLRMIQENMELLVDLSNARSTWRLELTVVVLILFEVMLSLWQMFNRTGGGH
ncbi:MAG: RMD1 family protein [Polyangia bacterium]